VNRRSKVAANGEIPQNAWADVKSSAVASLLDESLLYLQAARSRGGAVEADLCEITDTLFEELAAKAKSTGWNSFSVFATEDSFDVLTQIIRVRYPLSGVWDIPVAVHEFGHFLSGRLRCQRADGTASLGFEDAKNSFVPPPAKNQTTPGAAPAQRSSHIDWRAWLDEIFADVFATYAAGPSFAFSCLLVRFDPASSQQEVDGKHPSYAKRAHVILQTLRLCDNEQPGRGKLKPAIQLLDSSWQGACKAAGTSPDVSSDDQAWIDSQVNDIYYMLKINEGGLRFSEWDAANRKATWLEKPNSEVGEFTLLELLNAAWICRLNEDSKPQKLSEAFVGLARRKTQTYDK
jgi:hypothetical protein